MNQSILIDATHFCSDTPSGVELYTDSLLPQLAEVLLEKAIAPIFASHKDAPKDLKHGIRWIVSPHQLAWGQRVVPKLARELEADAYFTPSGIPPINLSIPYFFTVHDLSVYKFPLSYPLRERLRTTVLAHKAGVKAAGLFTPSEYTAQQVCDYWHIPKEKVTVTPLAEPVEDKKPLHPEKELVPIPRDLPWIVCVGRLVSKKDIHTLVRGFAGLRESLPARLILAGRAGFGYSEIEVALAELSPTQRDRVHLLSYITATEKQELYRDATIVAVPGPYEGFGIPALEALAAGKLVVATDSGAVPEITGELAVYAKPHDTASWTKALTTALVTPELRAQMMKIGPKRAQHFTWRTTAERSAAAIIASLR